jgi:hypothetical protein
MKRRTQPTLKLTKPSLWARCWIWLRRLVKPSPALSRPLPILPPKRYPDREALIPTRQLPAHLIALAAAWDVRRTIGKSTCGTAFVIQSKEGPDLPVLPADLAPQTLVMPVLSEVETLQLTLPLENPSKE